MNWSKYLSAETTSWNSKETIVQLMLRNQMKSHRRYSEGKLFFYLFKRPVQRSFSGLVRFGFQLLQDNHTLASSLIVRVGPITVCHES